MSISLAAVPGTLEIHNNPTAYEVTGERALEIAAGAKTDWFFNPSGPERTDNAPAVLFPTTDEYFLLSARVQVQFASTFDAGVLQLRIRDDVWGKLCFEYSPQKQPMIVSVVTRKVSDDCNSVPRESNQVYLRLARLAQAFAFHYSADGKYWNFVRHFAFSQTDEVKVGFSAQSPTGDGCAVTFTEIAYETRRLADLRNGE